jgi:hypothetical protein
VVEKSVKWNAYLQQLEAGGGASANATLIGEALKESFMAIDIMIRDEQDAERAKAAVQGGQRGVQPGYGDGGLDTSGCTAVVCIVNEKVWSWFRGAAWRGLLVLFLRSLLSDSLAPSLTHMNSSSLSFPLPPPTRQSSLCALTQVIRDVSWARTTALSLCPMITNL